MELTSSQWFGLILSLIVLSILIYWIYVKIRKIPVAPVVRSERKANKFTQHTVNLVDRVLCKLKLSARKNQSIKFYIHEGHSIHYEDIDLVIYTDNYHAAKLKYKGEEILIYPNEVSVQEKIKNFFLYPNQINESTAKIAQWYWFLKIKSSELIRCFFIFTLLLPQLIQ